MTVTDEKSEPAPAPAALTDGDGLDKKLVAPAPAEPAQPYLEVVAPATLAEGYTFQAEANGQTFTVKVPMGGVKEGQKFSVPFPGGADGYSGAAIPRGSVPVGQWKDGLFDCFKHGVIHPALWNACCCPLILVGQVMQRLKLTWLGAEGGTVAQTSATFQILLRIVVGYFFVDYVLKYASYYTVDEDGKLTDAYYYLIYARDGLNLLFVLFTMVLVARTRKNIRARYGIPEERCRGCEDCCCAYWCTCCAAAQMARHTADYEAYPGMCCSETGLSPQAEPIV